MRGEPMITGTFLDEISHDIASANWGPDEWRRDFASMKADGIDTVVLIRAGYKDRATFDARVLRKLHPHLIVQEDLVALFLSLAAEHGMSLWFGSYDSGEFWQQQQHQKEADLNRALVDEVWERYGRSSAFRGWYLGHEIDARDEHSLRALEELCGHIKATSGLPILIAPRPRGTQQSQASFTLEQHRREWTSLCAELRGRVDCVAFQDGGVPFALLPEFLAVNAELARANGLANWSSVESFDRDVHVKYPPIAWPKLRYKLECALAAGVSKLITFEYSHFLSPHSMYSSAHALHRRYREWLATQR
ncbi:MAG: DUF4434 domain-containing protein [Planctomycetes bacterium]|nr:DUF4434 domain-containing protein [Planctomycetota bacterium]